MQPTLCSRCKKRVAVVYISKIENGKTVNEGLCLKCAKDLGLPQVNWRLTGFSAREYEKLYNDLHEGNIKVERLSDVSSLPETPNVAVDILG